MPEIVLECPDCNGRKPYEPTALELETASGWTCGRCGPGHPLRVLDVPAVRS